MRTKIVNGVRIEMSSEEETFHDEKDAAWESASPSRSFERLREKRNKKLTETDWRFRSDQTPSQDWIDYSQTLRDFPAQYTNETILDLKLDEITWPTKPES